MGEIADEHYDAMMDGILDGDDEDSFYSGRNTPRPPRCNRCGSTDVRWRQQTGKWVLFSSKPGVEHVCANRTPDTDGFTNEEGEQA